MQTFAASEANRFAQAVTAVEGWDVDDDEPGLDAAYRIGEATAIKALITDVANDSTKNYDDSPWAVYEEEWIEDFFYREAGGDPNNTTVDGLAGQDRL